MGLLKDHLIAHYKMNENTASDNDELVTNGNFAVDNDPPDDWNAASSALLTTEAGGQNGNCLKITENGAMDPAAFQSISSIVVGRKYKLSFYVKQGTEATYGVTIADQTWLDIYSTGDLEATGSWVKSEAFFVVPEGTTSIYVTLYNRAANGSGLTLYYDEISVKLCAAEDRSENDHDMLMQQDTDAISVAGKINTAFDFNGSSDYGEIADHADFTPILTPFSISIWVYMHTFAYFIPVSKWQAGANREWLLYTGTQKKLHFHMHDDDKNAHIGRTYGTSLAPYENQWTHFVATYDGGILSSGLKIYLNGVRVDDANSELNAGSFVAVENLAQSVWIGRYSANYSDGLFDNVMFFNKELSPLDVKLLYNGGAGRETIPIGIENQLSRTGQRFLSHQL